jgi:hypothetical protein
VVKIAGRDLRTLGRFTQPAAEWLGDKSDALMEKYVEPVVGQKATEALGKSGELALAYAQWDEHPELWLAGGPITKGLVGGAKALGYGAAAAVNVPRAVSAAQAAGRAKKTATVSQRAKAFSKGIQRGKPGKLLRDATDRALYSRGTAVNFVKQNLPSSRIFGRVVPLGKSTKDLTVIGTKKITPGLEHTVVPHNIPGGKFILSKGRYAEDVLLGTALGTQAQHFDSSIARSATGRAHAWHKSAVTGKSQELKQATSSQTTTPAYKAVKHTTPGIFESRYREESVKKAPYAHSLIPDSEDRYGKKKKKSKDNY